MQWRRRICFRTRFAWMALSLLFAVLPATGADSMTKPSAAATYPPVLAGMTMAFPRDHGAHSDYRTEWWYVTGWLVDEQGHERGFQLTFFRVRTLIGEASESRFSPRQLILAHAAIADPENGRLLHTERSERLLPPLVLAEASLTDVRMHDWQLTMKPASGGKDVYRARVDSGGFGFDLELVADGAPVLNGAGGFSRKGPAPEHASYYYSRPQMQVEGRLRVGKSESRVSGRAWLDHEWSSEIMAVEASGWDWIGINLHDGGALMAFQMRNRQGDAIWAGATLREANGRVSALRADEVQFTSVRNWRSPRTGALYPVEWRLEIAAGADRPAHRLHIEPLMDDQELDSRQSTGAIYWEGAVRLFGDDGRNNELGKGYLEMTGYTDPLRM